VNEPVGTLPNGSFTTNRISRRDNSAPFTKRSPCQDEHLRYTALAVCELRLHGTCPPQICVTKGVVCAPTNGVAGCTTGLVYGPIAFGVAGTNQAAFCYRIVLSNCGPDVLTNVVVSDNLLGSVAGSFPSTLAIGQSVTNYYGQSYGAPSTNVNTVTANGTGASSGVVVSNSATATAIVRPISV
jgi:hypothetical protein